LKKTEMTVCSEILKGFVRLLLSARMIRQAGNQQLFKPEGMAKGFCRNVMCPDDRKELLRLRAVFHQQQKNPVKDRRLVSFFNELQTVLEYTERSSSGFEERCIMAGVAFGGSFISVNTQQLKAFVGRCKSSINGSFQQLGFLALRTKAKARKCLLRCIPSMADQESLIRQWTVRWASETAAFCFISSFSCLKMPGITREDLFDEKAGDLCLASTVPVIMTPFKSHFIEFDLPSLENLDCPIGFDAEPLWRPSFSMDSPDPELDDSFSMIVKPSESAHLSMREWGLSDDDPMSFGLSL
jgi:hypothetical protein